MAVQFDRTSDLQYTGGSQRTITNESSQLGQDAFLQLLVTQMKYQDPLNPADSKESIAQMAQFSALEQMQNLNKSFEEMIGMQSAMTISNNAQYVGKFVSVETDNGIKSGEVLSVSFRENGTYLNVKDEDDGVNYTVNVLDLLEVGSSNEAIEEETVTVETTEEVDETVE